MCGSVCALCCVDRKSSSSSSQEYKWNVQKCALHRFQGSTNIFSPMFSSIVTGRLRWTLGMSRWPWQLGADGCDKLGTRLCQEETSWRLRQGVSLHWLDCGHYDCTRLISIFCWQLDLHYIEQDAAKLWNVQTAKIIARISKIVVDICSISWGFNGDVWVESYTDPTKWIIAALHHRSISLLLCHSVCASERS